MKDSSAGRRKYAGYLEWLAEGEPRQKALNFERMSKGWAVGSDEFKGALLEDEKSLKACLELGVSEAKEMRERAWERALASGLESLGVACEETGSTPKSANWKVALAGHLKQRLLCLNCWLAERLEMGTGYGVSRYVNEMLSGKRRAALKLYDQLDRKG